VANLLVKKLKTELLAQNRRLEFSMLGAEFAKCECANHTRM
jgi:hypothetical protein